MRLEEGGMCVGGGGLTVKRAAGATARVAGEVIANISRACDGSL